MMGAEFRDLRTAARLSRQALARQLAVHPSSIQRWEADESPIPSQAADTLRQLAGDSPQDLTAAYALGRLFAVLEGVYGRPAPQGATTLLKGRPAAAFGALFSLARRANLRAYQAAEPEIEALLSQVAAYPPFLASAADGELWRGYYTRRAERRSN